MMKFPGSVRDRWKIRMTHPKRKGMDEPETWIWNRYRDEDSALNAFRNLGTNYSFYFIEVLDPEDKVLTDNREAYEFRQKRDAELRAWMIESPTYKVI